MASRIGGPQTSPVTVNYGLTWGSMRRPLAWRASNGKTTVFSRTYPVTADEEYPRFFIWNSGSMFRAEPIGPYFPNYTLLSTDFPETPPGEWAEIIFGVGKFGFSTVTVDNQDFDQLVGEAIDTDIGTYTIDPSAHTDGEFQLLQEDVPIQTIWIYSITGLTAI